MAHADKKGPSRPDDSPAPPDREALEKTLADHGLELHGGRVHDIYTGRALGTLAQLGEIVARLKGGAGG